MSESSVRRHQRLLPGVPLIDSPFFEEIFADGWFTEAEAPIAHALHRDGFALLDFPDPEVGDRADRIRRTLHPLFADALNGGECFNGRLMPPRFRNPQDQCPDVGGIAGNNAILTLLEKLYGREAFPFQTLIFQRGSQQHLHSDAVHFNSWPKGFMCGVWLALEDITQDNGPLMYHPGSHKWAVYDNDQTVATAKDSGRAASQAAFHDLWNELGARQDKQPIEFRPRKGQALIWAANLLHGGAPILDPEATRWSQVTHYFFEDCAWYRPMASHVLPGSVAFIDVKHAVTGEPITSRYAGAELPEAFMKACSERRAPGACEEALPDDFDGDRCLELNPDVATAGADPHTHYAVHGRLEGRQYR